MLRAGLTEVLVTGMLIRWISVRPRPIAIGAKPLGARSSVAPRMTIRNMKVITNSQTSADDQRIAAGRVLAVAVRREAGLQHVEVGLAAGDEVEHGRAGDGAGDLGDDVRQQVAGRETARRRPGPSETAGFRWQPETWPNA